MPPPVSSAPDRHYAGLTPTAKMATWVWWGTGGDKIRRPNGSFRKSPLQNLQQDKNLAKENETGDEQIETARSKQKSSIYTVAQKTWKVTTAVFIRERSAVWHYWLTYGRR